MKKLLNSIVILTTVFCCLFQTETATARIYLDITGADIKKLPVAIPYFIDKDNPGQIPARGKQMADLMGRALNLHGFFSIIPSTSYRNDRATRWQTVGADYVVLGSYDDETPNSILEIRFMDTRDNKMIAGKRYRVPPTRIPAMVRKFCDEVIYNLTGDRGISNTQIAFVSDQTGKKEIYMADILGKSVRQVTRHRSLTVSPRFSPDGTKLAYSSYHRGTQILYITNLNQSKTTKALSWRNGLNVAPAWSPDGKTMVTTLSKDGNPDLYLLAANGNVLSRLTHNEGINISASWSPDGTQFTFVSDRSGTPQIYIMDARRKKVRRLTYSGLENTTPSWSPTDDLIAYTGKDNGNYHLFTISPEGGSPTQLTQYWGDHESPTWSPDGKQILFSRLRNKQKQLCRLFLRGRGVTPLLNLKGNQTFPQWSPRLKY